MLVYASIGYVNKTFRLISPPLFKKKKKKKINQLLQAETSSLVSSPLGITFLSYWKTLYYEPRDCYRDRVVSGACLRPSSEGPMDNSTLVSSMNWSGKPDGLFSRRTTHLRSWAPTDRLHNLKDTKDVRSYWGIPLKTFHLSRLILWWCLKDNCRLGLSAGLPKALSDAGSFWTASCKRYQPPLEDMRLRTCRHMHATSLGNAREMSSH